MRNPVNQHICTRDAEFNGLSSAIIDIKDTLRVVRDLLTSHAVLGTQAVQFRKDIDVLFSKVHKLEVHTARASGSSTWIERVIWVLICAGLAGLGLLQP